MSKSCTNKRHYNGMVSSELVKVGCSFPGFCDACGMSAFQNLLFLMISFSF